MTQASKTTKNAKAAQSSQMTKTAKTAKVAKVASVTKAPAAIPQKAAPKTAAKSPSRQMKSITKLVTQVKAAKTESSAPPAVELKAASKQCQLIEMLRSSSGATIAQMIAATGWQAHTVRGTVSGSLRKRLGLKVVCGAEGDVRVYRIVEAA